MAINVNISVNCDTQKVKVSDSTDYTTILGIGLDPGDPIPAPSQVYTIAKLEWGDGITVTYGSQSSPFVAQSTGWEREVHLRHGTLKLTYTIYESLYGSQVGLPQVFEFTVPPDRELAVTEDFDMFMPSFFLTDATDYSYTGYTVAHSRAWETGNGTGGSQSVDVGVVPGEYDFSLTNEVTYAKDDVEIIKTYSLSGVYEIKRPIMLPEFIACLKLLLAKRNAMSCCNDAQYALINEDFQTAMGLFNLFTASGQVPVTADLEPVYDEILAILHKWGINCDVDDTDTTPISTYDFCLCPGGGGADREVYNAGNGAWIAASAAGITFAKAAGVGTFSGVGSEEVFGGTVQGTDGDAVETVNSASQSFVLVIPTKNANLAGASALIASCTVYDGANISSPSYTNTLSKAYDVPIEIVGIGSNTVSIAFIGIGATHTGGWLITFINP